jgi:hypothetical protein
MLSGMSLVMASGAGLAFMNLLQMLVFMMLLNVALPQNFYDFLSIFSVQVLDFIPNPLKWLVETTDFDPTKFSPPPKF